MSNIFSSDKAPFILSAMLAVAAWQLSRIDERHQSSPIIIYEYAEESNNVFLIDLENRSGEAIFEGEIEIRCRKDDKIHDDCFRKRMNSWLDVTDIPPLVQPQRSEPEVILQEGNADESEEIAKAIYVDLVLISYAKTSLRVALLPDRRPTIFFRPDQSDPRNAIFISHEEPEAIVARLFVPSVINGFLLTSFLLAIYVLISTAAPITTFARKWCQRKHRNGTHGPIGGRLCRQIGTDRQDTEE